MGAGSLLEAGRSDFHVHTSLSPDAGRDCSLENLAAVARQAGVKFTLDSDAHRPWDVAEGLRCLHVSAERGFTGEDFVDFDGLRALRAHRHRPGRSG